MFALNQHGISVVSDIVKSGTTADSVGPERPTDLTARGRNQQDHPRCHSRQRDSDLEITLDLGLPPVDPDGAPVKSYEVQYSVDGNVWDPVPEVKKPGDKHTMLTDETWTTLEAGVGYQYKVSARRTPWTTASGPPLPRRRPLPGAIPDVSPIPAKLSRRAWRPWN